MVLAFIVYIAGCFSLEVELEYICPFCKTRNHESERYCVICGCDLTGAEALPKESSLKRLSSMLKWFFRAVCWAYVFMFVVLTLNYTMIIMLPYGIQRSLEGVPTLQSFSSRVAAEINPWLWGFDNVSFDRQEYAPIEVDFFTEDFELRTDLKGYGSQDNPVPLGVEVDFAVKSYFGSIVDNFTIRVDEVVRGEAVEPLLRDMGSTIEDLESSFGGYYEYLLINATFTWHSSSLGMDSITLPDNPFYGLVSLDGEHYSQVLFKPTSHTLKSVLYPGDSFSGWVAYEVPKSQDEFFLTFEGVQGTLDDYEHITVYFSVNKD